MKRWRNFKLTFDFFIDKQYENQNTINQHIRTYSIAKQYSEQHENN